MSLPYETTVTCPGCGAVQAFHAWRSLNVTLEPETKQKFLRGDFTRVTCTQCAWSGPVVYPFLYHDMEKQLMIWLWLDGGEPDLNALPPGEEMKGYRLRFVATQNELLEKILLFDADLDDRVIECLKFMIHTRAAERNQPLAGELYFAFNGKVAEGSDQVVFELVKGSGKEGVTIPIKTYQNLAASLAPKLSSMGAGDQWLRVGRDFVQALIA